MAKTDNSQHFSEFSEAYAVPGDVMTKGADFLTEAERLWEQEENKKANISVLQGTLLLYERCGFSHVNSPIACSQLTVSRHKVLDVWKR